MSQCGILQYEPTSWGFAQKILVMMDDKKSLKDEKFQLGVLASKGFKLIR